MWGPFSGTSGTYELPGNLFTIRPIVAKNPGFMGAPNFTMLALTLDGEDIWIRVTGSPAGPIPSANANRANLVRVE